MSMKSVELRQERAKLVKDAGAILDAAQKENRAMTSEESTRFDKMHDDADVLLKTIERMERQEERERGLAASTIADPAEVAARGISADPKENAALERGAFRSWLRGGLVGMTDEERALSQRKVKDALAQIKDLGLEARAAQTVTSTGGGYLIPREFQAEVDRAMLAFGPMLNPDIVRVIPTASGAPMDWPTVNDTSNKGTLLGINTTVTVAGVAVAVGQKVFGAYKFNSEPILVPFELAQDAYFPLDEFIRDVLAERLGRIINDYLTTGTGSSQPQGIVVGATASGIAGFDMSDMSTGITTSFSWYDQLVLLEHSVDPAYRVGASFMFHDTFLRDLKRVRDTQGNPIWQQGTRQGAPDTILGYPYSINQSMANTGTNANIPIIFGNMKKYIVRKVRPAIMLRLVERFAEFFQIGYVSYERCDGGLVDAGTHPVKSATVVT